MTNSMHIYLDDCKTREHRMFRALDVAIQWLDQDDPKRAREVLAEVYCPILVEEEEKFENKQENLLYAI